MIMPTMIPKGPRAEPKISMTRILTNMRGSCASDRAQAEPTTPTQIPQKRLARPTVMPVQKKQYPPKYTFGPASPLRPQCETQVGCRTGRR